jgi:hypothetical protein
MILTPEERKAKIEQYYLLFLKARYDNDLTRKRSIHETYPEWSEHCRWAAEEAIVAVQTLEDALQSQRY